MTAAILVFLSLLWSSRLTGWRDWGFRRVGCLCLSAEHQLPSGMPLLMDGEGSAQGILSDESQQQSGCLAISKLLESHYSSALPASPLGCQSCRYQLGKRRLQSNIKLTLKIVILLEISGASCSLNNYLSLAVMILHVSILVWLKFLMKTQEAEGMQKGVWLCNLLENAFSVPGGLLFGEAYLCFHLQHLRHSSSSLCLRSLCSMAARRSLKCSQGLQNYLLHQSSCRKRQFERKNEEEEDARSPR